MDSEIEGTSAAEEAPPKTEEESFWWNDRNMLLESRHSIFIAPEYIRNGRASDFEPKLVSIGPYYHGRENLKRMEELKLQCLPSELFHFEKWVGEGIQIPTPLDPLMLLVSYARSSYQQNEQFNLYDVNFVRMLVFDSCFIIRAILSYYSENVPKLFQSKYYKMEVRSDLLLLENQIPLFFIRKVYDLFFKPSEPIIPPFETVLESFICFDMPWRINHEHSSIKAAHHLLDLYWRWSLSTRQHTDNEFKLLKGDTDSEPPKLIPNATTLHQMAGIKFKKLNDESHDVIFFKKGHRDIRGLDVIFSNGIMRMPCLKIDSSQITLLLNLIAFENSMSFHGPIFSSYIKIMDALIESEKDVQLLQDCGVIHNTLSSHQMAATLFNDIGKVCNLHIGLEGIDYHRWVSYFDLFRDVNKYYGSSWYRAWGSLRHNYFSNPWAGISVFGGVTLLILSALQTFYTIYPYYNPRH